MVISELQNCLNFMEELLKTIPLDKQYDIKIDYKAYNSHYNCGRWPYEPDYSSYVYGSKDYPTEDDPLFPCKYCRDYDCMNCPHENYWNGQNK